MPSVAEVATVASMGRAIQVDFQIQVVPVRDGNDALLAIEVFDDDLGKLFLAVGEGPYLDELPRHVHVPITDFWFDI